MTILNYIACLLLSYNMLVIWYGSSISIIILCKILGINDNRRNYISYESITDIIDRNYPAIAELLLCRLCVCSYFTAIISSLMLFFIKNIEWYFVPLCTFSIPAICNILYKLTCKLNKDRS